MKRQDTSPSPAPVTDIRSAGIVGLGLIGGSIARALKTRAKLARVVALDRKISVLEQAKADGSIDVGAILTGPGESTDPFRELADCDVVFLCTPVEILPEMARRVRTWCGGILTDVGSVKHPVQNALGSDSRFIGGHPMAGSERTGYACSTEDLLENAVYVLCVPPRDDEKLRAQAEADADALAALVTTLGATPRRLDAAAHDRAVAGISHLPHAVASALSVVASENDEGVLSALAAGGFRDITRIASASATLWSGICMESAPALLPVMDAFSEVFERFRSAIADGDRDRLEDLFRQGADYRTNLPMAGRGALDAHTTLRVQIPDRPGSLADVAGILAREEISIRNMDISNIRMYDSGVLRLLLYDSNQAETAITALKEAGYDCSGG